MARHKFYIIGLGSMGRRRIRNLRALGVKPTHIYGFDPDGKRRSAAEKEYGIVTTGDFEKGFKTFAPTVFVISTPPDKHAKYFLFAAKRRIHFFVEVTTVDDGYARLMPLLSKRYVAAPSCTFRYVPAVRKMRELVAKGVIGDVLSFQHYLGQYLPDWHPYEDYRKVYFAQKKTGGAREMFPYELCWLGYLIGGDVRKVVGVHGKYSDLHMTADDIYAALLEYNNTVFGTVVIDLLNRQAARTLRIIGSKGTIEWDWLAYQVRILLPHAKQKIITLSKEKQFSHYNTTEGVYTAEMKDFLDAVNGKKPYPYSFKEDWAILKTLFTLEKEYRKLRAHKVW